MLAEGIKPILYRDLMLGVNGNGFEEYKEEDIADHSNEEIEEEAKEDDDKNV